VGRRRLCDSLQHFIRGARAPGYSLRGCRALERSEEIFLLILRAISPLFHRYRELSVTFPTFLFTVMVGIGGGAEPILSRLFLFFSLLRWRWCLSWCSSRIIRDRIEIFLSCFGGGREYEIARLSVHCWHTIFNSVD